MSIEKGSFELQDEIVRPITRSDLPHLLEFDNMATFEQNDTPPDHAPPPFTLKELVEMLDNGEIMRGIFDDGRMIAYYIFDIRDKELYIDSIAVHPDYRDNGVGTYLLGIADREALERGLEKCSLSVDPYNGRGVNTYLKHGYKVTEYKRAYFGSEYPSTDRFWMEKLLKKQNTLGEIGIEIVVSDSVSLEMALAEGFVGVSLIRSIGRDNKSNVLFLKQRL